VPICRLNLKHEGGDKVAKKHNDFFFVSRRKAYPNAYVIVMRDAAHSVYCVFPEYPHNTDDPGDPVHGARYDAHRTCRLLNESVEG